MDKPKLLRKKEGTFYFTVLDLNNAFSQLRLAADTSRQRNFIVVGKTLEEPRSFQQGYTVWQTSLPKSKNQWAEQSITRRILSLF